MVMSPLSSTSWQTTALEWIVNLSRLRREQVSERERMVAGWIHIGGMSVGGEFELGVEDANHDMQREQWPSRDLARSIVGRGREG